MAQKLSVIHILGFPSDFNGNVTRVLGEAIHVAKLGVDVEVIVSDQVPLKYLEQAIRNGVKIHRSSVLISWKKIGWRINNIFPLLFKTLEIVGNKPNSVLHIAAPSPVTKPLTASEIGKRLKKPMVLDLHDPWSANPFALKPIAMLQTKIMKRAINNADFIVVAHTALYKLVRRINKNKPIDLIPNAVDTELFRPRPRNIAIAESIGINGDDLVVAFCGHILEHKGLNVLVRSARIVHQKHKNVKFLVIGDGPARKQVEVFVDKLNLREIFRFVGFVSQELAAEFLSLADICVAPYKPMAWYKVSLPETPLKVVEYMTLGKPVVMSKISDENVIAWSGGGLLTAPDDAFELASNIINLVKDEKLRKTMGEKGRRYIEEHLSWSKIANRLMEIYQFLGAHA